MDKARKEKDEATLLAGKFSLGILKHNIYQDGKKFKNKANWEFKRRQLLNKYLKKNIITDEDLNKTYNFAKG